MNLYQSLGFLILGSRLRRLSESFLSEINKTYQQQGIEFEAAWFPAFYLLQQKQQISIKELSSQTGSSHPAASQLITQLKNKGLVVSTVSQEDARQQQVALSAQGEKLLQQIKPIWEAIEKSFDDFGNADPLLKELLPALNILEPHLKTGLLSGQIIKNIKPTDHE